jgi:hypothetical protein
MNPLTLRTSPRTWQKYQTADFAENVGEATTFAASTTKPGAASEGDNLAKIMVYGATGDAAKAVYQYLVTYAPTWAGDLYLPTFVCKLKWTWTGSGNQTGSGSLSINSSQYFADKVELIDGDTSIRLITDTNLNCASVDVDLCGAKSLAMGFDDGGESVTEPATYNSVLAFY